MNAVQTRTNQTTTGQGYCGPDVPPASNIGNDVTTLNDALDRLNNHLCVALDRIRGPVPEKGCSDNPGRPDVSLRARINQADHSAERAEALAKEILGLLGE